LSELRMSIEHMFLLEGESRKRNNTRPTTFEIVLPELIHRVVSMSYFLLLRPQINILRAAFLTILICITNLY